MKPHPRIRKTIKWGGAAVTVLLVVVWIGSGWWSMSWAFTDRQVGVVQGRIGYLQLYDLQGGLGLGRGPELGRHVGGTLRWWFGMEKSSSYIGFVVPVWLPALLCGVATSVAWREDSLARRRAKLNLCPKCGYDRTGILKDAKCPECGSGSEQAARP